MLSKVDTHLPQTVEGWVTLRSLLLTGFIYMSEDWRQLHSSFVDQSAVAFLVVIIVVVVVVGVVVAAAVFVVDNVIMLLCYCFFHMFL